MSAARVILGQFHFMQMTNDTATIVGTLFYAYAPESNLGSGRGFYMAVNIGA